MSWGKSKRHLGHGLGQGPPRNPSLASWSSVHTIISFQWGSIPFPPYFFPKHTAQTTAGRAKREADDPAEPQIGVLCSQGGLWMSHTAPHLKDEETWLHLWLICECPNEEIELQKGFALWPCLCFKLVRFCWRFTTQPWMCGFNILTSLVKGTVKNCFGLSY